MTIETKPEWMQYGNAAFRDFIRDVDRDSLLTLKMALETTVDAIKTQIARAKAKVHTDGEYSDPDWFVSVHGAQKALGRKTQMIQQELSRQKNNKPQNKADKSCYLAKAFVSAARSLLHDDTFSLLMDTARDETDRYFEAAAASKTLAEL